MQRRMSSFHRATVDESREIARLRVLNEVVIKGIEIWEGELAKADAAVQKFATDHKL